MADSVDNRKQYNAISLFSNCGAGDLGYNQAGFNFVVMAELDERRLEVCKLNHSRAHGVVGDLRVTWPSVVSNYRKISGDQELALLAACPPCQGMSTARSNRGKEDDADAGSRDDRNLLVTIIAKVTDALSPKIVVVENVRPFLTRKVRHPVTGQPISAAKLLAESLEDCYVLFPFLTDLCDYGVPQTRVRSFLTFIRRDIEGLAQLISDGLTPYPFPTHVPQQGGLEPASIVSALASFGLSSLDAVSPERATSDDPTENMHLVPVWPDRRYDMVAAIPVNSGASAWENEVCAFCGPVEVSENDSICPKCREPLLRPVVQDDEGNYRLVNGYRASSYRRMHPNQPAATITTASGHLGSDYNIHPFENRLLSPLECALLQTFPRDFNWGQALEKWGHTNVRDMIGEAVPPHFTRLHGEVLVDLLSKQRSRKLMPKGDIRCTRALLKLDVSPIEYESSLHGSIEHRG